MHRLYGPDSGEHDVLIVFGDRPRPDVGTFAGGEVSALGLAAYHGDAAAVTCLVERCGADLNAAVATERCGADGVPVAAELSLLNGANAAYMAAAGGHVAVMEAMQAATPGSGFSKVNWDAASHGSGPEQALRPVHVATLGSHLDCLEALARFGADMTSPACEDADLAEKTVFSNLAPADLVDKTLGISEPVIEFLKNPRNKPTKAAQ